MLKTLQKFIFSMNVGNKCQFKSQNRHIILKDFSDVSVFQYFLTVWDLLFRRSQQFTNIN